MNNYFVGKICTILTVPTHMPNLNKAEMANIFTGTVEGVDGKWIMVKGLQGLKAVFNTEHIIGILEEKVVLKNDAPVKQNQPLSMESLGKLLGK